MGHVSFSNCKFNKQYFFNILFCLPVAIYGLQKPFVYIFALILFTGVLLLKNFRIFLQVDILRVVTLFLFVISYGFIGVYHNLVSIDTLYNIMLVLCVSYIYSLYARLDSRFFVVALCGTSVLFVSLSTYLTLQVSPLFLINSRGILNFWTEAQVNTPTFGLYLCVGMSLFIYLVVAKKSIFLNVIITLLFFISALCLIKFQSRGPFLTFLIVMLSTVFIYRKLYFPDKKSIIYHSLCFTILSIFSILYFIYSENSGLDIYLSRIEEQGVESDRYRTWMLGIESMFFSPFGGREIQLNQYGTGFIHNSFLDISFISGIIPLIFLFVFYSLHFRAVVNLFSGFICERKVLLFVFGLSSFLCLLFEPALQASPVFFSFHIIFLGLTVNYKRVKPVIISL